MASTESRNYYDDGTGNQAPTAPGSSSPDYYNQGRNLGFQGCSEADMQNYSTVFGQPAGGAASAAGAPQQPQSAAPSGQQQHEWKYAGRGVSMQTTDYANYSGYRDSHYQQLLAQHQQQIGGRGHSPELENDIKRLEQTREMQLQQFEKTWQEQQHASYGYASGGQQKHIVKEGVWAPTKELEYPGVPFPIHGKAWKGEELFLQNMEVVETFLSRSKMKMFYKNPITCQVCGCELENSDLVDETNRVSWPAGFIHYLGDHNNPPSKFFYNYANKAAAAIQQMYAAGNQ